MNFTLTVDHQDRFFFLDKKNRDFLDARVVRICLLAAVEYSPVCSARFRVNRVMVSMGER